MAGLIDTVGFRYAAVTIVGYVLDLGISSLCIVAFDIDILVSAIIGFVIAVIANYTLHQFWTFGDRNSKASASKLAKYLAAALATIGFRALVISMAAPWTTSDMKSIIVLVIAAGTSLVLNYFLTRFGVFRNDGRASARGRDL